MAEPAEIQIAIQGGGAKLCTLLAAAEALQELEAADEIRITRLAGTSAGSIVACILAAGIPASEVRGRLQSISEQERDNIFPKVSFPRMIWKLVRGIPIYDEQELRKLLEDLISSDGKFRKLGDLERSLLVTATDLRNKEIVVYKDDDKSIVDALMDSCAIPLAIRSVKNVKDSSFAIVDGGICENLPAHVLLNQSDSLGKVVGIALRPSKVDPKSPKNVIEFGLSLLNAAIDNSMARARDVLGEDGVCEIETDIGTFDFARALSEGLGGDHYGRVKAFTLEWFRNSPLIRPGADRSRTEIFDNPWNKPGAGMLKVMSDIHDVYKSQYKDQTVKVLSAAHVFFCYCLLDADDGRHDNPDIFQEIVRIQPAEDRIYCYAMDLNCNIKSGNIANWPRARWWFRDGDGNRREDIVVLPAIDRSFGGDKRESGAMSGNKVIIYFCPPLGPNDGPFSLTQEQHISGSLEKLRPKDGRGNRLGQGGEGVTYVDGVDYKNDLDNPISQVDFVFHVPLNFPKVMMSLDRVEPTGKKLEYDEMSGAEIGQYGDGVMGLRSIGWRFVDVAPKVQFSLNLSIKGETV